MLNLGRIGNAVLYGFIVFIVVLIIGYLCQQFGLPKVGDVLIKFAPLLGLLSGIVVWLNGNHPVL